ncbi:MAG: YveK family protein [Acidimicrobiales bacterium]
MSSTPMRAVRRYWLLVPVAVVGCLVGAAVYVRTVEPRYATSADVLVSPVTTDRAIPGTGVIVESVEPIRAVQTAAALIETDEAARRTAAVMGGPWTMEQVRLAVTVRPRGQSNVIEVEASTTNAEEASRLATAYATESVSARNADVQARATELFTAHERAQATGTQANALGPALVELRLLMEQGDPSLSVVTPAPVPDGPVTPSPPMVMVLAALVGLLGGVILAVAVDALVTACSPSSSASSSSSSSADPALGRIPPRHRSIDPGVVRAPREDTDGVRYGVDPDPVAVPDHPGGFEAPARMVPAAGSRSTSWGDDPVRPNGWAANGHRPTVPRGYEGPGR